MTWLKLDMSHIKEYEVDVICDSKIYAKELDSGYLAGFYYLVF